MIWYRLPAKNAPGSIFHYRQILPQFRVNIIPLQCLLLNVRMNFKLLLWQIGLFCYLAPSTPVLAISLLFYIAHGMPLSHLHRTAAYCLKIQCYYNSSGVTTFPTPTALPCVLLTSLEPHPLKRCPALLLIHTSLPPLSPQGQDHV